MYYVLTPRLSPGCQPCPRFLSLSNVVIPKNVSLCKRFLFFAYNGRHYMQEFPSFDIRLTLPQHYMILLVPSFQGMKSTFQVCSLSSYSSPANLPCSYTLSRPSDPSPPWCPVLLAPLVGYHHHALLAWCRGPQCHMPEFLATDS